MANKIMTIAFIALIPFSLSASDEKKPRIEALKKSIRIVEEMRENREKDCVEKAIEVCKLIIGDRNLDNDEVVKEFHDAPEFAYLTHICTDPNSHKRTFWAAYGRNCITCEANQAAFWDTVEQKAEEKKQQVKADEKEKLIRTAQFAKMLSHNLKKGNVKANKHDQMHDVSCRFRRTKSDK